MVRPNQIIQREGSKLTFIIPARSEGVAARRVLLINFPGRTIKRFLSEEDLGESVADVETVTEGEIGRYAVTVDMRDL